MRFTYADDIRKPVRGDKDLTHYYFSDDLRRYFPKLESNHEIGDLLLKRRVVVSKIQLDCESACTWAYFDKAKEAKAFLARLNEQKEIKNYVDPPPDVTISGPEWERLKRFLKKTLTADQYSDLQKLEINVQIEGA